MADDGAGVLIGYQTLILVDSVVVPRSLRYQKPPNDVAKRDPESVFQGSGCHVAAEITHTRHKCRSSHRQVCIILRLTLASDPAYDVASDIPD